MPADLARILPQIDGGPHPGPLPSDGRGNGCRPPSVDAWRSGECSRGLLLFMNSPKRSVPAEGFRRRDADGCNREVRTTAGWPAERAGRAPQKSCHWLGREATARRSLALPTEGGVVWDGHFGGGLLLVGRDSRHYRCRGEKHPDGTANRQVVFAGGGKAAGRPRLAAL